MKSKVVYASQMSFIQGELYVSTDTNTIVICNETTFKNSFKGTCLIKGECENQEDHWVVGKVCHTCYGPKFIPFKGTIELTGE